MNVFATFGIFRWFRHERQCSHTGSGGLPEILSDLSLIRRLEDDHLHRHLHIQLIEFVQHHRLRLIMFEGGDHGLSEFNSEVEEQALHWFNKYVRDKEPLPDMEYHGK